MYFAGKTEEQIKNNIESSPLGRLGETKDIAEVVGFMATDASEWINGQVIRANGGYV
jgi:3-oxoacyl-[acyl-carrier protein] reductase